MSVARIETVKTEKQQYAMNPKKFMLWAFLVTVTIMFAGFTSAIVVSRTDAIENGTWIHFEIPTTFLISTIIVVLSSVSMQWAYFAARKNEIDQNRYALWITMILGAAFLYMQYLGFKDLIANNVFLDGIKINETQSVKAVSTSFFYIITIMHGLHIAGGVLFVAATLFAAYKYRVHSLNMLRINLCTTYWHFIGALWVYLFAILKIYC